MIDQERIAELEAQRDALRKALTKLMPFMWESNLETESPESDFEVALVNARAALAGVPAPRPTFPLWNPIDTAPFNKSVLVYIPDCDHRRPGIYRVIRVNMGSGIRWHSTVWLMGRDAQPTHWMPLPEVPYSVPHKEGR